MKHTIQEERQGMNIGQLLKAYQQPVPDDYRKRLAVNRITAQFSQRPVFRKAPFYDRLMTQAGYISKGTWVTQFILLLLAAWMFTKGEGQIAFVNLVTAAAVAPLFGLIGCVEIARSFSNGMWELEDACRYPLKYVMSMRMAVLGLGDLFVFAVLILCNFREGGPLLVTAAFLLVPFHLSNTVYLSMLIKTGGKCPARILSAAGIIMAVMSASMGSRIVGDTIRFIDITGTITGAGIISPGSAFILILASLFGMLGAALLFVKSNQWEVRNVWN